MPEHFHSLRRPTVWLVVAMVFTLLGALSATQLWVGIQSEGPGGVGIEVSLRRLLSWQLGHWLAWGLLTPVVLVLGRRFPLTTRRVRHWAVHVVAGLAIAVVHTLLATLWLRVVAPFGTDPRPFLDHVVGRLASLLQLDLLVYAAILGVAYAVSYYRRLRIREIETARLQSQLAEARLETLTAQLRPHFLFNTLHGVAGLVRDGRGSEAVDMLEGVSDLLRYSLRTREQTKVPLHDEIAILERYLDIQRIRYGDRLTVEIEVEPDVETLLVPAFLLQPLAENSIRHGVAKTSDACLLRVCAASREGRLQLRIADSGPGIERIDVEREAGIGLSNTQARLKQMYGTAYRFSLQPRSEGGTVVTIEIPLEPASEESMDE